MAAGIPVPRQRHAETRRSRTVGQPPHRGDTPSLVGALQTAGIGVGLPAARLAHSKSFSRTGLPVRADSAMAMQVATVLTPSMTFVTTGLLLTMASTNSLISAPTL